MTETKLKNIIADQLGIIQESINLDLSLIDDLRADSLDLVDIVLSIERTFGIAIEDHEYSTATTVGKILSLIESKLSDV
jgi:acyl carrier protein